MSLFLVAFGLAFLATGAFTGMARWTNPSLLFGLASFQNTFGEAGGGLAHLAVLTLLPLVVGLALLVSGMMMGR